MVNWTEIAKFVAGAAAIRTVDVVLLRINGLYPMDFFGFTITETQSTIHIIFSAILAVVLIYYAWIKK